MAEFDVAVAGLGAMGSAALAACAARGVRCVGFDRFAPPHSLGASSGKSRLIRQAYFEDPRYVPLLLRAYDLWHDLERRANLELLRRTGLLMIGRERSRLIAGSLESARRFDLPVHSWDAAQVRKRYPAARMHGDEVAVYEEAGGMLAPELAVRAQIESARSNGALIRFDSSLAAWHAAPDGVEISLTDGECLRAKRLVFALGPWSKTLLEDLGVRTRVQRNVQVWFEAAGDAYDAARFPSFLMQRDHLPAILYGFPDAGDGVKAAFHGFGEETQADEADRTVHPERDVEPLARSLDAWMPGAAQRTIDAKVCLYTLTDDENFVVDLHPAHSNVVVLAGFSGHGFKFAPVIGEIAAQLALDGGTPHAIELFSFNRFAGR